MPDLLYQNILLAEDDLEDYEFFRESIGHLSHHTIIRASDGEELMKMIQLDGVTPDIFYLDVNMPKKNGLQCLIEIRQMPQFRKTPVIIMSTTRNKKVIETFYHAGANLYVCKPSVYQELRNIIEKTLRIDWYKHRAPSPYRQFVLPAIGHFTE